jgi:hypothetical protein
MQYLANIDDQIKGASKLCSKSRRRIASLGDFAAVNGLLNNADGFNVCI